MKKYCPLLFRKESKKDQFCRGEECEWYIDVGNHPNCIVCELKTISYWFFEFAQEYINRKG